MIRGLFCNRANRLQAMREEICLGQIGKMIRDAVSRIKAKRAKEAAALKRHAEHLKIYRDALSRLRVKKSSEGI